MHIDGTLTVFGDHEANTLEQMHNVVTRPGVVGGVLCADGHLGYAVPIGGVVAYDGKISPSGVGYDIACGNKAVLTDMRGDALRANIKTIMDDVWNIISFGVGRKNAEPVDHDLFTDNGWQLEQAAPLKALAQSQLGTVGSGNHYVDLFTDEQDRVWIGCHFGSRGLGHKLATAFLQAAGGVDGMMVDPVELDVTSDLGQQYIIAMNLAGRYAYAGRDWVCDRVAKILGATVIDSVHNHHNFAWEETHDGQKLWVVRKGATPAFPGQRGFVGGSMGDTSVILEGVDTETSKQALYSTVHGSGRVMGRKEAVGNGKFKKVDGSDQKQWVQTRPGKVTRDMMMEWITPMGVELRGAGADESPHCYRRLPDVLKSHGPTIKILHTLTPVGVAMASADTYDPYKD
jgi:tRNA-splicing ligase RtcB (3'-phosphate/5'-hydroxy nucleic acid ligase)